MVEILKIEQKIPEQAQSIINHNPYMALSIQDDGSSIVLYGDIKAKAYEWLI